jgi:hypothetical protein
MGRQLLDGGLGNTSLRELLLFNDTRFQISGLEVYLNSMHLILPLGKPRSLYVLYPSVYQIQPPVPYLASSLRITQQKKLPHLLTLNVQKLYSTLSLSQ